MVKKETDPVVEMKVVDVDVAEELVKAAEEPKPKKAKKPNKLQIEIAAMKAANARVCEILDARAGGSLTVRTFQQMSAEIKGLLSL